MRRAASLAPALAAAGIALACAPAATELDDGTHRLCGVSFSTVEELTAQLRRDRRYREVPGPETEVGRPLHWFLRSDPASGEEWLIATSAHAFYPAASCARRQRTEAGRWPRRRETYCGAGAERCAAFDRFLARRDALPSVPPQ